MFDTLLATMLVSIFLFMALEKYIVSVKVISEQALKIELQNIRTSIMYYTASKGKLPKSLNQLIRKGRLDTWQSVGGEKRDLRAIEGINIYRESEEGRRYSLIISGTYSERMIVDEVGTPTDVFGNTFNFDPGTGRVTSSTEGYEGW